MCLFIVRLHMQHAATSRSHPWGICSDAEDPHKQPIANQHGVTELVALLAPHDIQPKKCLLDKSWNVEYIYLHLKHDTRRHMVGVVMQQSAEAVLGFPGLC